MVNFHKSMLLLAVLLMAASMASAQVVSPIAFTCTASAAAPPIVRAEGLAEYVGDAVLVCSGGTPTAWNDIVPLVNWRIFLNTNVTSALLSGNWTESILAIDDPSSGSVAPLRGPHSPSNTGLDYLRGIGAEPGINYANPTAAINQVQAGGINNDSAVKNVFQGELVADNQIEWRGVPVDPPGTQSTRVIRITNVRANANAFGVSGTFVPAQLTMFISATGTTQIVINNPTQIVAVVQDGMEFEVVKSKSYLQCESNPKASDSSPCGDLLLKYEENFPTAFLRRGPGPDADEFGIEIGDEFDQVNTESNYKNPAIDSEFGSTSGYATQGTRLLARFNNVPAGVTIRVYERDIRSGDGCSEASTIRARFVDGADSVGEGDTVPSSDVNKWAEVNGSATWEIVDNDPDDRDRFLDEVYFAVDLVWTANTTAGIPALGTASVSGSYAPLSTKNSAQKYSSEPHPRFFDDSESWDLFTINSCATNLLWVYVTNQAGFDTGMVISNTSMDPFNTATQEGACTIYYYGFTTGGGAAPAPVQTPVVPAGEHAIWTLSSGGTVQTSGGTIAAVPGFQGYVIAHCEFQMAHGYAFISDLGASKLAQGYLALVMDEQFALFPRTGSQSELLTH